MNVASRGFACDTRVSCCIGDKTHHRTAYSHIRQFSIGYAVKLCTYRPLVVHTA